MNRPFPFAIWPLYKAESQSLILPRRGEAIRPGDLQHVARAPGGGMSYHLGEAHMPHEIGIYRHDDGSRWYVKGYPGWTFKPDKFPRSGDVEPSDTIEEPNKYLIPSMNSGARHEHTAHQLYGLFATPENHIGVIPSRLISGRTGQVVSSDYDHGDFVHGTHHHIPMYLATPEVQGASPLSAPDTALANYGRKPRKNLMKYQAKGAMVDALLGLQDIHEDNILASTNTTPKSHRIYRIDTGESMGWASPLPYAPTDRSEFFASAGPDTQGRRPTVLPDIVRIAHPHLISGTLDTQDVLDQCRQVIDTWMDKHEEIVEALRHTPHPALTYNALRSRIAAMQRMVDTYGGTMSGRAALGSVLLGFTPRR